MNLLRKIDPFNTAFLTATHLLAVAALALYATVLPWSWATFALALVMLFCTSVSITGGYHRLFAHRSYAASVPVRLFYLLFGAASFQNSAIRWSADHRRHHGKSDTDDDPYSIKHGFFWAHIGWLLTKADKEPDTTNVPDLWADRLVAFQHRHIFWLGALVGFGLPTALAWCWGDALGGFFLAGWVRVLLQYHATFSVNSVAHTIGRQPYNDGDSARDSVVTALVTLGEGYHNFHHTFPNDYRNGVRAYHFDPTKWFVTVLAWLGQAWNLRRVPDAQILRQRIKMDMRRMIMKLHQKAEQRAVWESRLTHAREQVEALMARWEQVRKQYAASSADQAAHLAAEMARAKAEFKAAYRAWCRWVKRPELVLAS